VLAPVHVLLVQPHEGVREDAGAGGVAEAAVDEGHSQGADQQAKAKAAEAWRGKGKIRLGGEMQSVRQSS
jgi:hypothetical protein